MSKYEFGFDKSNDKDYNCVTVLDTETNELEAYYRYQDIARDKDQRIEELEKENEEKEDKILDLKSYNSDLKETISKLSFGAVRCQAINDEVCQYILDNELLKKENAELKDLYNKSIEREIFLTDEERKNKNKTTKYV